MFWKLGISFLLYFCRTKLLGYNEDLSFQSTRKLKKNFIVPLIFVVLRKPKETRLKIRSSEHLRDVFKLLSNIFSLISNNWNSHVYFFRKEISDPSAFLSPPSPLLTFHFFWGKYKKVSLLYVQKILTEMSKQCFSFERRR